MHVTIATAEPRGAYHLAPLREALVASAANFTHLIPYQEQVQGQPAVPTSSSIRALTGCDRLVVTGGVFSAWTELVTQHAVALGIPVVFTELAYVGTPPPHQSTIPFLATTALSPDSAPVLKEYLGSGTPTVTGIPALDDLPSWRPVDRQVLLLSTSDSVTRDREHTLIQLAHKLRDSGWHVRVRTHPREDVAIWDGFDVVKDETQAVSAASAQVVIGYPGSAHVLAAAVGPPVIALEPSPSFKKILTPRQYRVMAATTTGISDTLDLIRTVHPCPKSALGDVVGPLGGAAQRIVSCWASP